MAATGDRQRGDLLAASGANLMAIDTRIGKWSFSFPDSAYVPLAAVNPEWPCSHRFRALR